MAARIIGAHRTIEPHMTHESSYGALTLAMLQACSNVQ